MTISSRVSGGELIITLDKMFNFTVISEFRKAYESAGDAQINQVSVDFKNTTYLDSSALGMLINMQKHLSPRCSQYQLINVSESLKKIFTISHFDKKFKID